MHAAVHIGRLLIELLQQVGREPCRRQTRSIDPCFPNISGSQRTFRISAAGGIGQHLARTDPLAASNIPTAWKKTALGRIGRHVLRRLEQLQGRAGFGGLYG